MTVDELQRLTDAAEAEMSEAEVRLWKLIRIPPVKWQQNPWGIQGGGFWVVARFGQQALWYNDIEDGFNISRVSEPGAIDQYLCNQDKLHHALSSLLQHIESGAPLVAYGPPEQLEV